MKLYALASLLIAGIVATTSYAPRWPTPALDYWIAADAILSNLSAEMAAVYDGADADDALTNLRSLHEDFTELDPPAAMLATHSQIGYALQSCAFDLSVETTDDTAALLILDCQRAIKDARAEAARYAATVGGFPVTVSP